MSPKRQSRQGRLGTEKETGGPGRQGKEFPMEKFKFNTVEEAIVAIKQG